MSKTTRVLIAGLIAGCGAVVVATLVIPPAHAQTRQRWETLCVRYDASANDDRVESATNVGNTAGRQGWEPFSQFDGMMCFKRPAP